jgi:hypothetical protein
MAAVRRLPGTREAHDDLIIVYNKLCRYCIYRVPRWCGKRASALQTWRFQSHADLIVVRDQKGRSVEVQMQ